MVSPFNMHHVNLVPWANARYLRLDCANSPLTGDLTLAANKTVDGVDISDFSYEAATYPSSLVLWQKCESDADMTTPAYSNPTLTGAPGANVSYVATKFNNGVTSAVDNCANNMVTHGDISGANIKNEGCIECWIKPEISSDDWPTNDGVGYAGDVAVCLELDANNWIDLGLFKSPTQSPAVRHFMKHGGFSISDLYHEITWEANELIHIALTWNSAGVEGGADKWRLYVNNVDVNSGTDAITWADNFDKLGICGLIFNGVPHSWGGCNNMSVDNVKVYNEEKVDFSDRDTETAATTTENKLLHLGDNNKIYWDTAKNYYAQYNSGGYFEHVGLNSGFKSDATATSAGFAVALTYAVMYKGMAAGGFSKIRVYDGSFVINDSYTDTDFKVYKKTAGTAFAYDANEDTISIGDGGATNYARFVGDGELTLHGTARVTECMWLNAGGIKAPGAKPAVFVECGLTGAWQFADAIEANQESVSGTLKIPCNMDRSVVPLFHIGWSADGVSPGNAEWQLEYLWIGPNDDTCAAAQETLTQTSTASSTSDGMVFVTFTGVDAPGSTDLAMLWKITRLSAHANDTIADTVEMRGAAFTRTVNKLGAAT